MDKINALKRKNNNEEKTGFYSLANALLSGLPERSAEIVKKRFGISGKKPETLEKIGMEHGITRERVRQIISDTLQKISKGEGKDILKEAEDRIILAIEKNNGIIEESELVKKLSGNDSREANAIIFFGISSGKIKSAEERGLFRKSWVVAGDVVNKVKEIEGLAVEIFQKEKKLLNGEDLAEKITEKNGNFSKIQALNYLDILVKVKKNQFGKWGLSGWEEISPKGTREKIYIILKEKKEPLHFTRIAELIDEYGLSGKKAHPQTVHNELIKDSRFVLVGRGIYALKEWGYQRGTVKEVLEEILKNSRKPLAKDEILAEALKLRKVKKATVMINLNDAKVFVKRDNFYTVRK